MGKPMTNGCETPQRDTSANDLLAVYVEAVEAAWHLNEHAQGWEDFDRYVHPAAIALDLIASGITAWHLPSFYQDCLEALETLVSEGRYEIAAFVSKWLLDSLPSNPLDPDIKPSLEAIARYDYPAPWRCGGPDAYRHCRWPAAPEHYRCHLQWSLVELAEDAQIERNAETKTAIALYQMGRHQAAFDQLQNLSQQVAENVDREREGRS